MTRIACPGHVACLVLLELLLGSPFFFHRCARPITRRSLDPFDFSHFCFMLGYEYVLREIIRGSRMRVRTSHCCSTHRYTDDVFVVLTLSYRCNAVRGHRTGSNNSGAEDYLRRKTT